MLHAERLGVVLQPKKGYAKFNAGMIRDKDTVHMVYRWAQGVPSIRGAEGFNVDGYHRDFVAYAKFDLEGNLLHDNDDIPFIKFPDTKDGRPVYTQDPRIVEFEGEYIIFYSVWDLNVCRVGMSRTKDFKTLEHIGVIPTNDWDKDAFILPERIDGKIVYIHRIEPNIQIDYFDSFEDMLDPAYWADYRDKMHDKIVIKSEFDWENKKVGGSIPPIRTDLGWLFIYHGVADDRVPFCYRAGVALLDLDNPSKVVARLPYPILEPLEDYETRGDVHEVVFPQGAYVHNGYLYMSYGGADTVVALARYGFNELMSELKKYSYCEQVQTV